MAKRLVRDTSNRYAQIIERIFLSKYRAGAEQIGFHRDELIAAASKLGVRLPKNLGDLIYSFRYRTRFPAAILERAPKGKQWIIRPAGRARYRFEAHTVSSITQTAGMAQTKIPDSTPGVIEKYALNDEQALLAKLRYNRLVDVFTGVTCYSLQNHLRTALPDIGQIETDEVYIGLDRRGAHYVFPVQAKGGKDRLSIIQIEQDVAMCSKKFPTLVCRPIAAQFSGQDLIVLFAFEVTPTGVSLLTERHYRLVPPEELTPEEIKAYSARPPEPPF